MEGEADRGGRGEVGGEEMTGEKKEDILTTADKQRVQEVDSLGGERER